MKLLTLDDQFQSTIIDPLFSRQSNYHTVLCKGYETACEEVYWRSISVYLLYKISLESYSVKPKHHINILHGSVIFFWFTHSIFWEIFHIPLYINVALVCLRFSKLFWNTYWSKELNTERKEATHWKRNISAGQMADKYWNLQEVEEWIEARFHCLWRQHSEIIFLICYNISYKWGWEIKL
jgi:hypothetical protein